MPASFKNMWIVFGLLCFVCLSAPVLLYSLMVFIFCQMNSNTHLVATANKQIAVFVISMEAYLGLISASFGYSIAAKRTLLIIISAVLVCISIVGIVLLYHNREFFGMILDNLGISNIK